MFNIGGIKKDSFTTSAGVESEKVSVGGTVRKTATITRPNDTTQYAAGEAVADSTTAPSVFSIAGCVRANGGTGMISDVVMVDSASQATKGQFELWIMTATWTPDNDNAAFTPTDAECANVVAIVPLTTVYVGDATAGAGGNAVYVSDTINKVFQCASGSTTLYLALVVRNAYTPVANEAFTISAGIVQD